jgi:hypothetical protein
MRATSMLLGLVVLLAAGCGSGDGGSSSTGGAGATSTGGGTSTTGTSGTTGTTGTTGAGGWQCRDGANGTCTCTTNPESSGAAACGPSASTCCASCTDVSDSYQFCSCEEPPENQGCELANLLCSQTVLYQNPQMVQACPPQ